MDKCTLRILDEVNCKFEGVDPHTRRKLVEALKFQVPYARHMPSFKLGRWDGKVAFATVGGGTYINILEKALPVVIAAGYEIDIVDERVPRTFAFEPIADTYLSDLGITFPDGHQMAGEPIVLRPHQTEAINAYLQNPQSLASISTGAGKTIITACLSKLTEPYGRSICIVPSKSLVEQTEEDYRNIGLDVGVFFGDRKEWNHTHTICTWQSLSVFSKKSRQEPLPCSIEDFIDGVVCVMVDEAHSAQSNELRDLLTGPFAKVPIRWGMTGTIPKQDFQFMSLLCSIGPVVAEVKASDLQEKGILAKCHIEIVQTQEDLEFKAWDQEYDFLVTDPKRLAFLAGEMSRIAADGNTLILVNRIETGEALADLIPNSIFVNGSVKTKDRKKEYKEVQISDDKVIIATYGVAAVGINIPRIFNLVLVEAGQSPVRIIQSIGRALRVAQDKDFANIYDYCSKMKFSAKHLTKRKSYYKEAGYPFNVVKTRY